MATDADIEYAWVKGWVQAYHDLWDIFAIANAPEPPTPERPLSVTINGVRREIRPDTMTLEEAEAAGLIIIRRAPK